VNLCFVCKYPPIQGGVSTDTYWIARGLARRGHRVDVVTNAGEVEERYRIRLETGDASWYEPTFPDTGGRVMVHLTQAFDRRSMSHIPVSNPFVSKLAALATDVVRRHDSEAIFAYYYEPYAVAGWLASRWTNRPLVVRHAGSDLDRLMGAPGLATTYKEILRSAEAVITRPALMPRFAGIGVRPERLVSGPAFSVPTEVFDPGTEPMDLGHLVPSGFDPAAPTIGIYGKIGRTKGAFDLVAALGRLAAEGLAFNLLALIGATQGGDLAGPLREAGLTGRTHVLPFLPHWRVPSFIRACTAVCFLERDFPVAIHGPMVPREVMACGTCLVLSREIADRQPYRDDLVSGENLVLVDDPRDHAGLAAALRTVIADPGRAAARPGHEDISRAQEGAGAPAPAWEDLFRRHAAGGDLPAPPSELPDLVAPALVAMLRHHRPDVLAGRDVGPDAREPHRAAIRFCDALLAALEESGASPRDRTLAAAVRYQRARLRAGFEERLDGTPAYPVDDCLGGRTVTGESVWDLCPVRGTFVHVEEFDRDVAGLLDEAGGADGDLDAVREEPLLVLFQRSVNLIPRELRISGAIRELLRGCDGTRTTSQLVDETCRRLGAEQPEERAVVARHVVAALERLHRDHVVVFAAPVPEGHARMAAGALT
jgi:glycosyltransferase involved in cell wall biosynthesis